MRIRWTEPAVDDLTNISDYIQEHGSTASAHRVALAICDQIGGLAKFPASGRAGRRQDTRELSISGLPYLTVYRIRKDEIQILRILHGAQDWT